MSAFFSPDPLSSGNPLIVMRDFSKGPKKSFCLLLFVERGLSVLTSDFLWGLLFYWGIQLHHVTPNFILHISIFVHLCEAFLSIKPHFDLFWYLFQLKPQPNASNISEVGGARLQLRQGMDKKYILYKLPSKVINWKASWFYICWESWAISAQPSSWAS